jgi:hypothetical protein
LVEKGFVANITTVPYFVAVCEVLEDFGVEVGVGVGEEADLHSSVV